MAARSAGPMDDSLAGSTVGLMALSSAAWSAGQWDWRWAALTAEKWANPWAESMAVLLGDHWVAMMVDWRAGSMVVVRADQLALPWAGRKVETKGSQLAGMMVASSDCRSAA